MNHQVVFFSAFFYNDSTFLFKIFSHKNENREPELSFPMRLCQVGDSFAEAV